VKIITKNEYESKIKIDIRLILEIEYYILQYSIPLKSLNEKLSKILTNSLHYNKKKSFVLGKS